MVAYHAVVYQVTTVVLQAVVGCVYWNTLRKNSGATAVTQVSYFVFMCVNIILYLCDTTVV